MNGRELCVWLNGFEGLSADLLRELDPELDKTEIVKELLAQSKITEHCAERLKKLSADGWAEQQFERAEENGVKMTTWYDEDYPPRLRDIDEPPLLLYVKGRLPDFERSCSVVGTRRCTPYGMKVSEMLGAGLARAEYVVVSGGARGIDGGAHGGALSASGVTVAVLGTGIDIVWPPDHDELFANIVKDGALVSEYPFGTTGRSWRFPRRNRIIAGISGKLVVVESPMKGGAMITARKAMEM
ncbi:MAG: DNA-protecting protein DprA, partial [Pyramidobacter sp.]|nr:DNA-protecting protein DprA [Pyramidobacter sp.]